MVSVPRRAGAYDASGRPALPRVLVDRPALDRALAAALDHPVAVVAAPAGVGKTTAVGAWFAARPQVPVAWVDAGRGLEAAALTELLDARPAGGWVVVDDAHLLTDACLAVVRERLAASPDSLALVLVGRREPALDRLRPQLQGTLARVPGTAFEWTEAESRALLTAHAGPLPPAVVDRVVEYAGGWAAALTLAGDALAGSGVPEATAARLLAGDLPVLGELATEALHDQTPDARHLLRCVALEESVTVPAARHLSGDRAAGDLLAALAEAGVLVGVRATSAGPVEHRVHPVLRRALERALRTEDGEAQVARDWLRSVALRDVAQGQVAAGFRRLVQVEAWADAVQVMAERGDALVARPCAALVATVLEEAPELVEAQPRTWLTLALHRWQVGDTVSAEHWITRTLDADVVALLHPVELALLRLLAVRISGVDARGAVEHARGLLATSDPAVSGPLLSWMFVELAVAELWSGEVEPAAEHLRLALAGAHSLPVMRASVLSHLAQADLWRGRPHSAGQLALEALGLAAEHPEVLSTTVLRARVVRELAAHVPVEERLTPEELGVPTESPTLVDPTSACQRTRLLARRLIARGEVVQAARVLEAPLPGGSPGGAVRTAVLLDRAACAHLLGDVAKVGEVADELTALGAVLEAETLRAVQHDARGEPGRALRVLTEALAGDLPQVLPWRRTVAGVLRAQLLDAAGERAEAMRLVQDAVRRTRVQRVREPFLSVSRHGTPVGQLLERLVGLEDSAWLEELLTSVSPGHDLASVGQRFEATAVAPGPLGRRPDSAARLPSLTPREGDVLRLLARGSTYADVAVALTLSENTVKTHVSALYAKLGVARRSEALRAAREIGLI